MAKDFGAASESMYAPGLSGQGAVQGLMARFTDMTQRLSHMAGAIDILRDRLTDLGNLSAKASFALMLLTGAPNVFRHGLYGMLIPGMGGRGGYGGFGGGGRGVGPAGATAWQDSLRGKHQDLMDQASERRETKTAEFRQDYEENLRWMKEKKDEHEASEGSMVKAGLQEALETFSSRLMQIGDKLVARVTESLGKAGVGPPGETAAAEEVGDWHSRTGRKSLGFSGGPKQIAAQQEALRAALSFISKRDDLQELFKGVGQINFAEIAGSTIGLSHLKTGNITIDPAKALKGNKKEAAGRLVRFLVHEATHVHQTLRPDDITNEEAEVEAYSRGSAAEIDFAGGKPRTRAEAETYARRVRDEIRGHPTYQHKLNKLMHKRGRSPIPDYLAAAEEEPGMRVTPGGLAYHGPGPHPSAWPAHPTVWGETPGHIGPNGMDFGPTMHDYRWNKMRENYRHQEEANDLPLEHGGTPEEGKKRIDEILGPMKAPVLHTAKQFGKLSEILSKVGNWWRGGKPPPPKDSSPAESWDKFQQWAQKALLVGGSVAGGAVRAASPDMWATLTGSFSLLAAQIGTMLIPAFVSFSLWLQEGASIVAGWSEGTKSAIGSMFKWSMVGLVVTTGIYKLGSALGMLGTIFTYAGKAIQLLGIASGATGFKLGLLGLAGLGVVAGLGYLAYKLFSGKDEPEKKKEKTEDELTGEVAQGLHKYPEVAEALRSSKSPQEQSSRVNKMIQESREEEDRQFNKTHTKEENIRRYKEYDPDKGLPEFTLMVDAIQKRKFLESMAPLLGKAENRGKKLDLGDMITGGRESQLQKMSGLVSIVTKAQPQYSDVAEAYKKTQIEALGLDPIQQEMRDIALKSLNAMLIEFGKSDDRYNKLYEGLNGNVRVR